MKFTTVYLWCKRNYFTIIKLTFSLNPNILKMNKSLISIQQAEMELRSFINYYDIRPADVIRLNNPNFPFITHYVVYFGSGQFIANLKDGVKFISLAEIIDYLTIYKPIDIRLFIGTEEERHNALLRAYSRLGDSYDFFINNCEGYANYVQYAESFSQQTTIASVSAIGIGAVLCTSKNETTRAVGLGVGLLGLFLYLSDEHQKSIINRDINRRPITKILKRIQ